ncbi:hypothetical protein, partial [Polluticaenibacter yanchengensis]|nr:hypothetical protein [Chitinophagaceae bacterium LY-5]
MSAIPTASGGKIVSGDISSGLLNPGITSFITANNPNVSNKPKSYVNWLLLDEQFNYVESGSGAE